MVSLKGFLYPNFLRVQNPILFLQKKKKRKEKKRKKSPPPQRWVREFSITEVARLALPKKKNYLKDNRYLIITKGKRGLQKREMKRERESLMHSVQEKRGDSRG